MNKIFVNDCFKHLLTVLHKCYCQHLRQRNSISEYSNVYPQLHCLVADYSLQIPFLVCLLCRKCCSQISISYRRQIPCIVYAKYRAKWSVWLMYGNKKPPHLAATQRISMNTGPSNRRILTRILCLQRNFRFAKQQAAIVASHSTTSSHFINFPISRDMYVSLIPHLVNKTAILQPGNVLYLQRIVSLALQLPQHYYYPSDKANIVDLQTGNRIPKPSSHRCLESFSVSSWFVVELQHLLPPPPFNTHPIHKSWLPSGV